MDTRADRPSTDAVFKALADPARRRMLDLLRERPRTTGELAAAFSDRSRFAVMKHLGVLEGAGVVVVRRRGRERWNHLNAVPLREMYERWVAAFDDGWAASILAIEHLSGAKPPAPSFVGEVQEKETDVTMTTSDSSIQTAEQQREPAVGRADISTSSPALRTIAIEQEHRIAAAPEQVWTILTTQIGVWWRQPYRLFDDDAAIALDPQVGGALVERRSDGAAASWGTVSRIEEGHLLALIGPCGMPGAVYGVYSFTLDANGDGGTRLQLSHHAFGEISEQSERGYDHGWQEMLTLLKQVAEGT